MGYSTLFWVPGAIFVARDPRFTVSGPTSKLVVYAFSGLFVVYSTLFWVPGAIFGARDPRFTVSAPTSKLIVFAFSARFRGL